MSKSSPYETAPSSNNVALLAGSVESGSVLNQGLLRRSTRLSLKRNIKKTGEESSEHYDNEIKRTKTVETQPPLGLDHVEVLSNDSVQKDVLVDDETMEIGGTVNVNRSRFTVEEKGKSKVVEVIDVSDISEKDNDMDYSDSDSDSDSDVIPKQQFFFNRPIPVYDNVRMEQTSRKREMFRRIARESASKYARYSVHKEKDNDDDEDEDEMKHLSEANVEMKDKDWTGPFSIALKIVRDRVKNMNRQKGNSVPLWVPKENKERGRMKVAPSLQDLCMDIMVEHVNALTSLESVPDELRHKLSHLLCKSRKMNNHFLDLLASGTPSEIRIRDCSWLNEDQLTTTLENSDTSKLTVLQLDQSGRCLPDHVLVTTLTNSPSKFSALTNISLRGACKLSNAGLDKLVSSTPALRSINLGCCSLLTCDSIISLADKLGPILKELYIDECFGIVDAKSILPALLKLQHLEVLSISHIDSVNDSFVIKFVTAQGQKMKELILADCRKLTNRAVKEIAENCPGLRVIDLTNLGKLTDNALGYLANGCQSIQTLKFQRNAFSDEIVAAYVEARGSLLRELSLNYVDKVGLQTAISLAKHAKDLQSLNLSWCREIKDEALGLIADSCLSLKILKLFGCTQITEIFMKRHSNEQVKVFGLKDSLILKNFEVPDFLPLKYSAA